jgi:hypothetical protein
MKHMHAKYSPTIHLEISIYTDAEYEFKGEGVIEARTQGQPLSNSNLWFFLHLVVTKEP